MRRIPLASLILLAGIARAAEGVPSITPAATPSGGATEITVRTDAPSPPAERVVSPVTAAKLAAAAPKFTPPASEQPPPQEPISPVARTPDRPHNQIVRLPEFRVGEPKEKLPDSFEVLTPKGRVDLAFQRRPGLRLVPFGWMNAGIALDMLEDDLQAQRRTQAAELWSLYLIR